MELKCAPGQESTLLRRRGVGTNVTQEAYAIATNGDVGAIRIILFRPHFTYYHSVEDFLPFMDWDVVGVNKQEGVSACNPFCGGEEPVPMPWHSRPSSLA